MQIINCNCGCKDTFRDYISQNHNPDAPENRRRPEVHTQRPPKSARRNSYNGTPLNAIARQFRVSYEELTAVPIPKAEAR